MPIIIFRFRRAGDLLPEGQPTHDEMKNHWGHAKKYNSPYLPLSAGSRLGPYEIVAPLGAGGMGEVYRECDMQLGRQFAERGAPNAERISVFSKVLEE